MQEDVKQHTHPHSKHFAYSHTHFRTLTLNTEWRSIRRRSAWAQNTFSLTSIALNQDGNDPLLLPAVKCSPACWLLFCAGFHAFFLFEKHSECDFISELISVCFSCQDVTAQVLLAHVNECFRFSYPCFGSQLGVSVPLIETFYSTSCYF